MDEGNEDEETGERNPGGVGVWSPGCKECGDEKESDGNEDGPDGPVCVMVVL